MFTYIKLFNFYSLNNVVLDLKETKTKVKRIAAIYGENGSGKTNLLKSFYFLEQLLHLFEIKNKNEQLGELLSDCSYKEITPEMIDLLKKEYSLNIFKESRTIECEGNTIIEYGFEILGHEGYYRIEYNSRIVNEKLYYYTGKQSGCLFEINKKNTIDINLSPLIFKTSDIRDELIKNINMYWGKYSFLSIIKNITNKLNEKYINNNIANYLFDFINLINNTSIIIKDGDGCLGIDSNNKIKLLSKLESGTINRKDENILDNTENILNVFFQQTYSDVVKVYFNKEIDNDYISYNLLFVKKINGKNLVVPIEKESTGTRQVLNILRKLFGALCGYTVVIDEIDNGVHDLLLKIIIDSMTNKINGQLIFTTHNTSLLESLDPKLVYIINGNYDGNKELICLSDFKIQDHNSPRIRYMKGLFGGVPFIDSVDYNEIIDKLR